SVHLGRRPGIRAGQGQPRCPGQIPEEWQSRGLSPVDRRGSVSIRRAPSARVDGASGVLPVRLYRGSRLRCRPVWAAERARQQAVFYRVQGAERQEPKYHELPILPPLHDAVEAYYAAGHERHLVYLTTRGGKPFTDAHLSSWFSARCKEAGLEGLSAHGIRKF